MTIIEVQSRKDLMRFIRFPDELYCSCPQYVPALHVDQVKSLTRCPSLKYCERKMWLALEGDKVVGRICGMINPRYNELYGKKRARFGWFDCIDDTQVSGLLLSTAEAWAKERGMNEIHGPLYYNTLGKQGMLIEGFANVPPFNCIYNYPYYQRLVTDFGFGKECDWVQFIMPADHGMPEKTARVADMVMERYNLHFGDVSRFKRDKAKIRQFFDVYMDSFMASVYNFVPFTDEEIADEVAMNLPLMSERTCCLLYDENDDIVAFGILFPSISKALQKARGRLFPFGWVYLLKAFRDYGTMDLMLHGASSKWQNKGVSAVYYKAMIDRLGRQGTRWAISNPQIETNGAVNIWNSYEHEPFMRRRCFIKIID